MVSVIFELLSAAAGMMIVVDVVNRILGSPAGGFRESIAVFSVFFAHPNPAKAMSTATTGIMNFFIIKFSKNDENVNEIGRSAKVPHPFECEYTAKKSRAREKAGWPHSGKAWSERAFPTMLLEVSES
jgi:hypothetical protein